MDCSYRIYVPAVSREICFCDRELEVAKILDLLEHGSSFPKAIYGPEGCGKTTLLRYVMDRVKNMDNAVAIYIDALRREGVEEALLASIEGIYDIATALANTLPIGASLARKAISFMKRFHERFSLSGKRILLIVDDVYRAIGLDEVDRYTKDIYEWIKTLYHEYRAKSVLILLTTSEGISKRILLRHTYVHVYMVWNLPRRGFEELVEQLNPPKNIDIEELWRSTGGNPRALIELAEYRWNIEEWLREAIYPRLLSSLQGIDKRRIADLVEDPDCDPMIATELEDRNLMIWLSSSSIGERPTPDPELGIGREWAWQIPVYRREIMKLVKR